ncbi:hypothetical protein MNB_SV-14-339 [hydrothermal vent metagenome]|uniref:Uncharacterized protein n=1 Tax=hydrothermal vent metagenome TaxID=652676 RepID=A0A1W1C3M9_9ZZZZ
MKNEEKKSNIKKIILILLGLFFLLILIPKGIQEYVNNSFDVEKPHLARKVVKVVKYKKIKEEVAIIGNELKKVLKKEKNNKTANKIRMLIETDNRFCEDLEKDKEDNKIFDCYQKLKIDMMEFKPLVKDENISKLLNDKVINKETLAEPIVKEIYIQPDRRIKSNKEKIYETLLSDYNNLFNDYIENIEICKNLDIEYKNQRERKDLNEKVILKQNKNLIDCYETLELTSEGLESITEDLTKNYSKKIKKDTKRMIKVFSENKNMIKKNLIDLRIKIN